MNQYRDTNTLIDFYLLLTFVNTLTIFLFEEKKKTWGFVIFKFQNLFVSRMPDARFIYVRVYKRSSFTNEKYLPLGKNITEVKQRCGSRAAAAASAAAEYNVGIQGITLAIAL